VLIYYRISDASHVADRFADKLTCWRCFIAEFWRSSNRIVVVADNVTDPDLLRELQGFRANNVELRRTKLGNAGSFKYVLAEICGSDLDDTAPVYLCEDDYLHAEGCDELLQEGLAIADYVTCYDPGDKYVSAARGGNPALQTDYEVSPVRITASTHWKYTNSTSMTFAARAGTLRADRDAWNYWSSRCDTPLDLLGFLWLGRNRRRTVASCLPGRSTHTHGGWPGLFVDWDRVAATYRVRPQLPAEVA
jgi:hypothetical protein